MKDSTRAHEELPHHSALGEWQPLGWDNVFDAARAMGQVKNVVYNPIKENTEIYDKLFAEYKILHDYFGKGENDVMKRLKKIKIEQRSK